MLSIAVCDLEVILVGLCITGQRYQSDKKSSRFAIPLLFFKKLMATQSDPRDTSSKNVVHEGEFFIFPLDFVG